jgi:hypothetical protein
MCKDLHCGDRTLKEALSRLQADNWIKRCRRFGHSSVTYIFEKQADCLAFKAEFHPADSDLEIVRSGENPPIRTDVRSGENPPVDQAKIRPSIRRKSASGNKSKKNESKYAMNEWMTTDPICQFLRALPGYNPQAIETDRAVIVERAYSLEALEALWAYAQERTGALGYDNPIGLFLKMIESRQQSPAYLELLAERRRQAELGASAESAREERQARPAPEVPPPLVVDPSVTQILPGHTSLTPELVWQAARGELQLEMSQATFDAYLKPAVLVAVNGTWQIAVPNLPIREWLDGSLKSTVQRVLSGIVGQAVEPEFIVRQ